MRFKIIIWGLFIIAFASMIVAAFTYETHLILAIVFAIIFFTISFILYKIAF